MYIFLSFLAFLSYMNKNMWFSSLFQFYVSSQSPFTMADDLYIEGRTSGDLPVDDEDGEDDGSGSGSGDFCKETNIFGFF